MQRKHIPEQKFKIHSKIEDLLEMHEIFIF